ncbi:MAG: radical SAM protein [Alphaproteobacteria bacterium]|nr:radical SAM protein [Alphaproteobacteria bacterium]
MATDARASACWSPQRPDQRRDTPHAMPHAMPFLDPFTTATGAQRATVALAGLETLWINTGTLCNLACKTCYIESSPTNDALAYPTLHEVSPYLREAKRRGAAKIGFTGGEPFLNPDAIPMIEESLSLGFSVLVLTNAMRPMMRPAVRQGLSRLQAAHGRRLVLRVSLDGYCAEVHDAERGAGSFAAALDGIAWLAGRGFRLAIAGRLLSGEDEPAMRMGFAELFAREGIDLDASSPSDLVIFPQMSEGTPTPEITEACWDLLGKSPNDVMCASSRMVVKRKGADRPSVLACTLISRDMAFDLGADLDAACNAIVPLNHPYCSRFCVLGGASCSGA